MPQPELWHLWRDYTIVERKLDGKDHLQDLDVNGSIILKWIFNKERGGSVFLWNYMAEDMDKWQF